MRGLTDLAELEESSQQRTAAVGHLTEAAEIGESLRRQYQRPEEGPRIQWRLAGIYSKLVRLQAASGHNTAAFLFAERARAALLLRNLAERSAPNDVRRDAAISPYDSAVPRFDDIASALRACGRRTVLLSYFVADDQLFAFVIRSGETRVEMVTREVTADLAAGMVSALDRMTAREASPVAEENLAHLSEVILPPLRDMLDPADTLLIVPHGFLHRMPFHALQIDGVRLIERCAVAYLPSALALPYLTDPESTTPRAPVVIGAHFTEEASDVADLLKADKTLIGEQVDRQAVLNALPSADVIHLSAHGFFAPDRPQQSGWILRPSPEILEYLETAGMPTRNFWRSMMAQAATDAVVTVEDLSALRLRARLVTMSACESGLVEVDPADDSVGLIPALLSSGVRGVLGSLWKVDPSVTRRLMTAFYSQLQGQGWRQQPHALQTAMLGVMRDQPQPYFWAPFILVGGVSPAVGQASGDSGVL